MVPQMWAMQRGLRGGGGVVSTYGLDHSAALQVLADERLPGQRAGILANTALVCRPLKVCTAWGAEEVSGAGGCVPSMAPLMGRHGRRGLCAAETLPRQPLPMPALPDATLGLQRTSSRMASGGSLAPPLWGRVHERLLYANRSWVGDQKDGRGLEKV